MSGIIQYGACDVSFIALLQSAITLLLFVNGPLNPKYTIDFLLHSFVCYNLFLSYFSVVPLYACTLEGRK